MQSACLLLWVDIELCWAQLPARCGLHEQNGLQAASGGQLLHALCLYVFGLAAEPAFQMLRGKLGVLAQQHGCPMPRPFQQVRIGLQIGKAQERAAALARAKQLAGAANLQVLPGNLETIAGLRHRLQPRTRGVAYAA